MDRTKGIGVDPAAPAVLLDETRQLDRARALGARKPESEAEIEKAAGGFEALLLNEMLKAMWATVDSTGLLGEKSNQAEIYRDMFHQALADDIAAGEGIGVKKFLKAQLLRQLGKTQG